MPVGRHTCIDCKKKSPETELTYSLLPLAGWREVRTEGKTPGEVEVEWRCPACWASHKTRTRAKTQMNLPAIASAIDAKRKPES